MLDTNVEIETYRPLLMTLAYRMLGSLSEAEDIVQDALADYSMMTDRSGIAHEKAYLVKMVTNRCLNLKQSARKRRELYVGQWLPEPAVQYAGGASSSALLGHGGRGSDNPADYIERQENITYVMLVMLERLSAVERAVFLLRETLEFDYDEIAGIVQKSEANCRKIFSRSKEKLHGAASSASTSPSAMRLGQQKSDVAGNAHASSGKHMIENSAPSHEATTGSSERGVEAGAGAGTESGDGETLRRREEQAWAFAKAFIHAAETGNSATLVSMLAHDAVLVSDGGGKVRAAINPIEGGERIAAFFLGIARKLSFSGQLLSVDVSGQPGVLLIRDGRPVKVMVFGWDEENRISEIFIILNPDKLVSVTDRNAALS